jgi:hypothetical protein
VASQAPQEEIDQFRKDVAFLKSKKFSRSKIGEAMPGVGKGNFSKYYNGKLPITDEFLAKFYEAWGKELPQKIKEKNTHYEHNQGQNAPEDEEDRYRIKDIIVAKLVEGQSNLIKTNVILAESYKIAAESNKILVDNNQKLIALLIQQGIKPGTPIE